MQQLDGIQGLTTEQVEEARKIHGTNKLETDHRHPFLQSLLRATKEPMVILLLLVSMIYFFTGSHAEGIFMVFAIIAVFFISLYQESRSRNALTVLKAFSQPKTKVLRNDAISLVPMEEVVVGDCFIIEEGEIIAADGVIIRSNDFSVNESILTGESLPVVKSGTIDSVVFMGTLVTSGLAVCRTTAVGMQSRLGQIGRSLKEIPEEKSPLQVQMEDFVKKMAVAGIFVFGVICIISYWQTQRVLTSLLRGLTLAMSILPEEIPVAFTTFMALGTRRLGQLGLIVKQTRTVETLGSATVICVDKTGTLTRNEMALIEVYDFAHNVIYEPSNFQNAAAVITTAMWASEPIPFDPMEKALHNTYGGVSSTDLRPRARMIHEYPLAGVPPLMTHVFVDGSGNQIIAAKGAPEAFLKLCPLESTDREKISKALEAMAGKGYRVLGVAESFNSGALPEDQQQFNFTFRGLVAFYDPPKENIAAVLKEIYQAGVKIKIITGDNSITTRTLAQQINFRDGDAVVTGEQLMEMKGDELHETVNRVNIFTRMYPEAKLKVIESLKEQHNVVAMTGDGVNDAPALKAAHMGVAMGKRGSEVAKEASALILSNDDLGGMVQAIAMGRKIYNNLKKAIQYIISIHIPAILAVFLPLALDWPYTTVFTPVHIIFLELIMGPTCSIIYENEPIERNLMNEKPRTYSATFFRFHELLISISQGLAITAGLIFIYWYSVWNHGSPETITSMVFVTLMAANIFLTLVNRSFYYSVLTTITYKNMLVPVIICVTVALMILIFSIPSVRAFFHFQPLDGKDFILSVLTGGVSVFWFELYKWGQRFRTKRRSIRVSDIDPSRPSNR